MACDTRGQLVESGTYDHGEEVLVIAVRCNLSLQMYSVVGRSVGLFVYLCVC